MFVGVLAILWGVFAVLASIGAAISVLFTRSMMGMPGQEEAVAVQEKYMPWTLSQYALGGLVAVLLVIGGSALVRRRIASRKILIVWAIVKIPLVLVSTVLGFLVQREMLTVMMKGSATRAPNPAFAAPMMEFFAVLGVIIGLALGWVLPIFLLYWLHRAKIRSEMSAWR